MPLEQGSVTSIRGFGAALAQETVRFSLRPSGSSRQDTTQGENRTLLRPRTAPLFLQSTSTSVFKGPHWIWTLDKGRNGSGIDPGSRFTAGASLHPKQDRACRQWSIRSYEFGVTSTAARPAHAIPRRCLERYKPEAVAVEVSFNTETRAVP